MTDPDAEDIAASRRDMLAAVAVMAAVIGTVLVLKARHALAAKPSEAQCDSLVSRYVDQASRQHRPHASDTDIKAAQDRAQDTPVWIADVDACQQQLSAEQVECGLHSGNIDALERCLQ